MFWEISMIHQQVTTISFHDTVSRYNAQVLIQNNTSWQIKILPMLYAINFMQFSSNVW